MKRQMILCATLVLAFIFVMVPVSSMSENATDQDNACWGQATAVFTLLYDMGEHASQEATPRLGLRNLARALYEAGLIPDDSMQSLGVFVATAMGLSVDACM